MTETLLNQAPQATTYTTTDSPRYVQISTGGASVAPTYDGEGNLTFDGTNFLVYDFKNRLSEVWRLAVEGTAQAQSGTFVAPEEMRAGRRRVLDGVFERERGVEKNHRALKRQGRLKTQVAASGAAQSASLELVALYGYDPFNRRLLRIVTGSGEQAGLDQRFAYDGWREVEEFAADGEGLTSTKAFVWGNRIDELIAYHRRESGSSPWQSCYPVQGRLDSVRALRDASGAVVERVEYDLYGRASVYVGTSTVPQAASSVGNPYLYTGRRLDDETGFVYLRNRYLHTGMGRFLTIDPIGSWGDRAGMGNGYAYAGNGPATFSDPMGLSIVPGHDGPINVPPNVMFSGGNERPGRETEVCHEVDWSTLVAGSLFAAGHPGRMTTFSELPRLGGDFGFDFGSLVPPLNLGVYRTYSTVTDPASGATEMELTSEEVGAPPPGWEPPPQEEEPAAGWTTTDTLWTAASVAIMFVPPSAVIAGIGVGARVLPGLGRLLFSGSVKVCLRNRFGGALVQCWGRTATRRTFVFIKFKNSLRLEAHASYGWHPHIHIPRIPYHVPAAQVLGGIASEGIHYGVR